jgi:hypothetical protein
MMTTMAALLGASLSRLALVMLYLTPVVYTYMAPLQGWLRNRTVADPVLEPAR